MSREPEEFAPPVPIDEGLNEPGASEEQDIDLQALAEQVYALLRRELEWERERQGR